MENQNYKSKSSLLLSYCKEVYDKRIKSEANRGIGKPKTIDTRTVTRDIANILSAHGVPYSQADYIFGEVKNSINIYWESQDF